jgi:sarcosine oxidase
MIGARDGVLVDGALRSAREHDLTHEELSAAEVHERFPGFTIPDEMMALFEPRAGVLDPEACVESHLHLAARAGVEIHANEPVSAWTTHGDRVTLETAAGHYDVGRVALCTGSWTPAFLREADVPLWIERQVMHWFAPHSHAELFTPARCPIAMIEYAPDRFFYTLPDSGSGLKAAIHHEGPRVDPDTVSRQVDPLETTRVFDLLRHFLPRAAGAHRRSATCLYTNTPDGHFFIAPDRSGEAVLVVSACSGHGFKFASAIGEAVADILTGGSRPDLEPFGRARLGAA